MNIIKKFKAKKYMKLYNRIEELCHINYEAIEQLELLVESLEITDNSQIEDIIEDLEDIIKDLKRSLDYE